MASKAVLLSCVGSVLVALLCVPILAGWLFHSPAMTSLWLPGPNVKTNTAVALLCASVANLLLVSPALRSRWAFAAAMPLALTVALLGAATLFQHLTGVDLGIDQVLATEPAGAAATTSPNRMGPPASVAFLCLGLALLLGDRPSPRAAGAGQFFAFTASAIAVVPLIGYAYGFSALYAIAGATGIAMMTALALLILGLCVQAGRPHTGLAALLSRDDEVGVFARRLSLASIALPFACGWLLMRLLQRGLVNPALAISVMSVFLIVVLSALIWRTGLTLARATDGRVEAERALAEREQALREADQQKSDFLATLSHELRNPLAPIRFAVELLAGPPKVAEQARQTIARQIRHLTRLVDDLLDLTRISRNKLELHVRPCELRMLVRDALDAVTPEIRTAGHRLATDWPDDPVWVQADPDRVVQMIVNLLTNACRYTDPGGSIGVEIALLANQAVVGVRDTGHGIAAEDLARVFDRFVQVGGTRHGGLGIGLALVKALAELQGGGAEASSGGVGAGAEFRIRLPRCAPPALLESQVPAAAVARRRRVLVVDDNPDAAEMLGRFLTSHGHEVAVAHDAAEALRLAHTFAPDAGLLDIGLPDLDGYELARRLRAAYAEPPLQLVAITGWGQDADRERALAAGFDAHLTKPADPHALLTLLGEARDATGDRTSA